MRQSDGAPLPERRSAGRSSLRELLQHWLIVFSSHLAAPLVIAAAVGLWTWMMHRSANQVYEPTLEKIRRTHRLSVGYIPYYDMSFRDPMTGQVVGLMPDVLLRVVGDLGLGRNDVQFQATTWRDFTHGLNTGKYDLSIAGTFVTRERSCAVAFTERLFCLGNGILVRRGEREVRSPLDLDHPNVRVAVVQGEQGDEYARHQLRHAQLTRIAGEDLSLVCKEVESGHADAALSDQYILSRCTARNARLVDPLHEHPYYVLPIAWAVRQGDTEWQQWLSAQIVGLRDKGWVAERAQYWSIPRAPDESCITVDGGPCAGRTAREYFRLFVTGIAYTLLISFGAIVLGTLIGTLLALSLASKRGGLIKFIKLITDGSIQIFLSIPALVWIVGLHYMGKISPHSAVTTAILALGLNLSPFAAKHIASGIQKIRPEQLNAARAAGYEGWAIAREFKLPLAVRNSSQNLFVEFVTTLKLSSLASVIGVTEILFQAQQFIQETYRTGIAYVMVALSYMVLVVPASLVVNTIEQKRRQKESG